MSWRFIMCAALFVTSLLTANTIATKLITVGGAVLPAAIVIFPVSYIYAAVGYLKSSERMDAYDYATDFNPIRL